MSTCMNARVAHDLFGRPFLLWEIPLVSHCPVYLRVDELTACEPYLIVYVDAMKFLALWRHCPHESGLARGNPDTWRFDRKYPDAEAGFSRGPSNAVPLAKVVCNSETRYEVQYERRFLIFHTVLAVVPFTTEHASFINGITRTIWLLSHGAAAFPVFCSERDGAHRLHELAGVPGSTPTKPSEALRRLA